MASTISEVSISRYPRGGTGYRLPGLSGRPTLPQVVQNCQTHDGDGRSPSWEQTGRPRFGDSRGTRRRIADITMISGLLKLAGILHNQLGIIHFCSSTIGLDYAVLYASSR